MSEGTMSDIAIEKLLGGTEVIGHPIRTEMDFYEISRMGLPKKALLHLVGNLNLSIRAMAQLLNITERTIQRKSDVDLLDISTTEQVLQIAEVFSRGNEVFGSPDHFQDWMKADNVSLGGKRPIDLLPSRYGAQMVLDVIGRIEHGVFS
jgi:putative toxin-antitoxin system antitoxin component (TIGR02293 family)